LVVIHLGRWSPKRLGATYPPTSCEAQLAQQKLRVLAYLVLLRVEIARFTRTQAARLCCSNRHLRPLRAVGAEVLPPTLLYAVRTFLQCDLSVKCTSDGLVGSTRWIITPFNAAFVRSACICLITTSPTGDTTMIRLTELKLGLEDVPVDHRRAADAPSETDADRAPVAHPIDKLIALASQALGIDPSAIAQVQVFKRSFDARKAHILAVYIIDIALHDTALEARLLQTFETHPHILATPDMQWRAPVLSAARLAQPRPIVVGLGPCGLFAALALAQMGLKPIVLERGHNVRQRTKDTWQLWRKSELNPLSNVQFGEGGAGLFSDGKLYSQIKDPRFLGRKVMDEFVAAGAPADILFEAHPHIGTFKLVKVVEHMRHTITALGGDIRFGQHVQGLLLDEQGHLRGVRVTDLNAQDDAHNSYELLSQHVVMALGHSARDTFATLYEQGVAMHAKPLSVGVRIEHPQSVIDQARWGRHAGNPLLGAADYKLVHHASNGRAVYSFCMCPGGTVVAATSEPGHVVTNGMSQYSRNERNANAGLVVDITPGDAPMSRSAWVAAFGDSLGARLFDDAQAMLSATPAQAHPLTAIVLQRELERKAFEAGGRNYCAPAQRVGDFLANQASTALGSVEPSYKPGVHLVNLADVLPAFAVTAMREALPAFGKKIKGFDMADAVLTGIETRTSSPLRIDRDAQLQSPTVRGLFPGGEGAGYAGGILSAAVDGIKLAEAVAGAVAAH
jgi:uncharacterized protein